MEERITDQSYLFWADITLGFCPMCSGTYGQWYASNDINKLYDTFKEHVLSVVETITDYKYDEITLDNLSEILDKYECEYDFDKNINLYHKLKELLKDINTTKSYDEFDDYADALCDLFNKLGIDINFYLFKSPKEALKLVKLHNSSLDGDYDEIFQNDVIA